MTLTQTGRIQNPQLLIVIHWALMRVRDLMNEVDAIKDLEGKYPAGQRSDRTHRSETKHPLKRVGRLSNLRAPARRACPN